MAGIYIHIPFCKQKCSYCDFHFSTNLTLKNQLIDCLCKEIELRKNELKTPISTIYLGGGSPSILSDEELSKIFLTLSENFDLSDLKEVTLEANPDDLSAKKLDFLRKNTPINRLSVGVQSFYDKDLQLMNRAHDANEAEKCIILAQEYGFSNITIDLIYGSNSTTHVMWKENLKKAVSLNIPHISSYALTVEDKTILDHQIKKGELKPIDESHQSDQFDYLVEFLQANGYVHYEISNFGKEGFFSQHNGNYWQGIPYIGIGPSAHSYNNKERSWNIANNAKYIQSIKQGQLPSETEELSNTDRYNELVMIGLRTIWGIKIEDITTFPKEIQVHFEKETTKLLEENLIQRDQSHITLPSHAKFFADGIASRLFYVD